MPKALSTQANNNRFLDGVEIVWLVEATFDQYGAATVVKRYGSQAITISSNAYEDSMADGGLDFGWATVANKGGLAAVATASLKLRDEESISNLADTYVLQNDEIIFYACFIDGAQVASDFIEIARGVVESHNAGKNVWAIKLKDASKLQLQRFPTKLVDPTTYINAYQFGQPVPISFGNLNVGPNDGAGVSPSLAPIRMTDRFSLLGTAGLYKKTGSTAYQWYDQANAFAEIITSSEASDIITLDDPERKILLRPSRAKTSNDVTNWYYVADGDLTNTLAVGAGENLDVWLSGSPKLGELTALTIEIKAAGSYTYTVKDDTTIILGPTAATGDATLTLTSANFVSWDLALLNIEIDGSSDCALETIELDVRFDDFLAFQDQAPRMFEKVTGFEDLTAHYADGAVIDSSGNVLRNPTHILQAILRGKDMMELATAKMINGWSDAETSRASWYFDFAIDSQLNVDFLNDYCFQAGLHLYPEEGGWSVAAMDNTRTPSHFFHGEYHMPVLNGLSAPSEWHYDLTITPAPISDVINEVALRYKKHPAIDEYKAIKIASGRHRINGNCTIVSSGSTGTLTDSSATFVTGGVIVNEYIYVSGDKEYKVDIITDETNLVISPVDGASGVLDAASSTAYWLGPNLNSDSLLSQLSFKTTTALGGTAQETAFDDGGYKSGLIQDDSTAQLLVDHIIEWNSQPRDRMEFPLFHSSIDVQLGDVCYIDHFNMRTSKRPITLSTVAGSHNSTTTTLSVATGHSGLFRVNDYIYVVAAVSGVPECMKITAINTSTDDLTVTRGTLNTEGQALSGTETIQRCQEKWMVTGVKQISPSSPFLKVRVEQMPPSYKPIGQVVSASYSVYSVATEAEKAGSGFATQYNGKVVDAEADSNISYVG